MAMDKNGTRPSLWAGISSPMYKILGQEGYGVKLQGAISNITMETTGFGFMDDADLIQGAVKGESISTLLWKSQKMLKLWEELLRVTGGALDVKDKSDWTLIAFQWNHSVAKFKKMDERHNLQVRDHEEDLVSMKQIPPTQARETLGFMQAPSGDETPELEYLESKLKNGYLRSDRPHSDVKMLLELFR